MSTPGKSLGPARLQLLSRVVLASALAAPLASGGAGDLVTVKGPFIVTSDTSYKQKQPWAAMRDDGSFVIIYAKGDMFARRFDRDGEPLGSDFKLNPTIHSGEQDEGVIAMDPVTGDFAVVWSDRHGNDSDQMGCAGRFFRSDGVPYTPEQILNGTFAYSQFEPHAAFTIGGRVLTAWSDAGGDAAVGVFGRLYDRFGVPLTAELQLNVPQAGTQIDPDLACDRLGNFVVAFVDASGATGQPREIIGRRFDANGNPLGGQFLVNSTSTGMQRDPDVAMAANGDFGIAWQDESATDGFGFGAFARLYHADGTPKGPQFQISTSGAGNQRDPSIDMDYVGNFVCTWEDDSGGDFDVKLRRFDRHGNPLGAEITVNTQVAGDQTYARTVLSQSGQRMFSIWFDAVGEDAYGRLFELEILDAQPALAVGQSSTLSLELPGQEGRSYLLLGSFATSPAIPIGVDRKLALAPDAFFQFLLAFPMSPLGSGFAGTLDGNGRAQASLNLPLIPSLAGVTLNFAPVTLDPQSPTGVLGVHDPVAFVVQ
jgi:hypothetical protein